MSENNLIYSRITEPNCDEVLKRRSLIVNRTGLSIAIFGTIAGLVGYACYSTGCDSYLVNGLLEVGSVTAMTGLAARLGGELSGL